MSQSCVNVPPAIFALAVARPITLTATMAAPAAPFPRLAPSPTPIALCSPVTTLRNPAWCCPARRSTSALVAATLAALAARSRARPTRPASTSPARTTSARLSRTACCRPAHKVSTARLTAGGTSAPPRRCRASTWRRATAAPTAPTRSSQPARPTSFVLATAPSPNALCRLRSTSPSLPGTASRIWSSSSVRARLCACLQTRH